MDAAAGEDYRVRRSVLERETDWRLDADGLVIARGDRPPERIPYADVVEMRLGYDPTRFDGDRHRCDLTTAAGRRYRIVSTHYAGIGRFESRAARYRPFVRALARRLAAAAPGCRFVAGKRRLVYLAEHGFLLAMLAFLAFVLIETGAPLGAIVTVKLVAVVALLPMAVRYARVNWPRPFDPAAIPPDILPP